MKGFEITINDKELISIASDRILCVTLNHYSQDYELNICGIDSKFNCLLLDKKFHAENKIKVKVQEKMYPPLEVIPLDRNALIEEYYTLKKELISNGLILE
jgi:hypothetical protein